MRFKPGIMCKLKNFNRVILVQLIREHESKHGFWYKIIKITNMLNKGTCILKHSKEGDRLWDYYEELDFLTDQEKIKLL